ncbi:MAG: polyprenol monophosphomannose synthase [Bacteroidia bacterium]|nr:polyprenol monophosphomannose synthase [Bacteroidia bacterium]MDW8159132.1 polyprenol monophosphomannose synthase [Bacteroidia bacterium]
MSDSVVIIPTYNELENIERMIRKIFSLNEPIDILIVDDNSPDGTALVVQNLQKEFSSRLFLLQRPGKMGLGTAYVQGFQWALARGYKFILEMDADFSHNPEDLPRLISACREEGNDVAIGSRYITGVNVVNWPMSRVLLSYFASQYVRLITGMKVRDTTAGFVCYKDDVLKTILKEPIRFVGYAFQIEMKFKAWKYGYRLVEVPIIFTERAAGTSKMSGKIVREAIWGVLKIKFLSFFRKWEK